MPHIKVKKIDTEILNSIEEQSSIIKFCATSPNGADLLIGVEYKGEEFLIQLKHEAQLDMLKYDKVSRPLNVNLVKEALALLAEILDLDIVTSNIAISHTKPALSSKYFKKIKDFESIEFPFEQVAIEVGFGSGRHLLYQAEQNPQRLHIGLEIHTPSAQQVLKQIELQGIENIWVVNYDARLFLEMMPSNLCDAIFVHFPVPWDKKPQRRVISPSFVGESLRVLTPQGRLELRTDSDKYFWYSMETFFGLAQAEVNIVKNRDLTVTSKYEARWKKQEKDIYEVHLHAQEYSAKKLLEIDFSFKSSLYTPNIEKNLPKKAYIDEQFFIHIERVYTIDDRGLLIKCAFGSFDRPEHKYILLSESGCRYYSSLPVKTKANYLAHQKIMEYLTCLPISS